MEKITIFSPAFDKRSDDPKKNYGIGSVKCSMVLKGPEGAVHFMFGTGMFLPETMQEYAKNGQLTPVKFGIKGEYFMLQRPMGYDVGYHSPTPRFDSHEVTWPTKMRKTGPEVYDMAFDKIGDKAPVCDWIGVPCYSDGSAMRAETFMDVLLREGSDKIWSMLEDEYNDLFKQKK